MEWGHGVAFLSVFWNGIKLDIVGILLPITSKMLTEVPLNPFGIKYLCTWYIFFNIHTMCNSSD